MAQQELFFKEGDEVFVRVKASITSVDRDEGEKHPYNVQYDLGGDTHELWISQDEVIGKHEDAPPVIISGDWVRMKHNDETVGQVIATTRHARALVDWAVDSDDDATSMHSISQLVRLSPEQVEEMRNKR